MLLARTITHTSVRRTKQLIDSREFAYWRAEHRLKPWGDEWDIAAQITAAIISTKSRKQVRIETYNRGTLARRRQEAAEIEHRLNLVFRAAQKRQARQQRKKER